MLKLAFNLLQLTLCLLYCHQSIRSRLKGDDELIWIQISLHIGFIVCQRRIDFLNSYLQCASLVECWIKLRIQHRNHHTLDAVSQNCSLLQCLLYVSPFAALSSTYVNFWHYGIFYLFVLFSYSVIPVLLYCLLDGI